MCSHYVGERRREYFRRRFGIELTPTWEAPPSSSHVYPTQVAPFVRRPPERDSGDEAVPALDVQMGHFGLLPGFSKEVKYGTRTYNARTQTVASLASFKNAWAKGRHCIVPVEAFYEATDPSRCSRCTSGTSPIPSNTSTRSIRTFASRVPIAPM